MLRVLYLGGEEGLFATAGVGGVALAEVLVGVGSTAGLSAVGNSVAKSYRKQRATALSLVLSTFGLSAFFCESCLPRTYSELIDLPPTDSTVWRTTLGSTSDPTSAFLLLLALGCGSSMLFGVIFVVPAPHPSLSEPTESMEEDEVVIGENEPLLSEHVEESSPTERTPLKGVSAVTDVKSVSGWALLQELDFW